ncbi:uncharacterized protein LOC107777506 isoform X2 [Nicotiana tabacum]|uniref:Uncharacterized protein LOC107777506 isoform X2 n=1 Tax=Nicotiana tabacum TaxID=4097 RepID=A0AC58UGP7_TOBAC
MNVSLSFPHPSTFSKTQLVQPNSTTILFCFSSFPFHSVRRIPQLDKKRCRFVTCASSLQLPLLPFPIDQVLVPSETKTLHLYEARYLALLEEVEKLEIGALVSIRGVGRAKILKFEQAEPYLTGAVIPLLDNTPHNDTELSSKVLEIKEALRNLNSLEIKLKAPQEALLQTLTANSLKWSEKTPVPDCDNSFIPPFAELVSFAALQPVSGSSESELQKLQKKKLRAMDIRDTLERLEESIGYVQENISLVAAKLAIQSLDSRS